MTPVVQKEYDELFNTFGTEGWRLYIKSMEDLTRSLKDTALEDCKTTEELMFRKGQIAAFQYNLTLQATTENMYKITQEDEADEGN